MISVQIERHKFQSPSIPKNNTLSSIQIYLSYDLYYVIRSNVNIICYGIFICYCAVLPRIILLISEKKQNLNPFHVTCSSGIYNLHLHLSHSVKWAFVNLAEWWMIVIERWAATDKNFGYKLFSQCSVNEHGHLFLFLDFFLFVCFVVVVFFAVVVVVVFFVFFWWRQILFDREYELNITGLQWFYLKNLIIILKATSASIVPALCTIVLHQHRRPKNPA